MFILQVISDEVGESEGQKAGKIIRGEVPTSDVLDPNMYMALHRILSRGSPLVTWDVCSPVVDELC